MKQEKTRESQIWKNIVIILMGFALIVMFLVAGWLFFFCCGGIWQEYITVLPSEYGNWSGHIDYEREQMESGLYIFPDNISDALDVNYLYYTAIDYHSIGKSLIYAEVTYTEADYQKEIERIADIECEIPMSAAGDRNINTIQYSEELFAYPAYIAIYASNLSYEYALTDDENNKIIYVYSLYKDANGIIPEEYLPKEVIGKNMFENNSWDNINIYYSKDKNGDYASYNNGSVIVLD